MHLEEPWKIQRKKNANLQQQLQIEHHLNLNMYKKAYILFTTKNTYIDFEVQAYSSIRKDLERHTTHTHKYNYPCT